MTAENNRSKRSPGKNGGEELRRALAPLAGDPLMDAQRVMARIREEEAAPRGRRGRSKRSAPRSGGRPVPLLHRASQVAWPAAWAAAGFLFGLLVLQGQEDLGTLQTEMPEGPHMVLAKGQVFLDQDQQRRLLPVGAPIPDGSHVETSDEGTCLVSMRDGSAVLLDRSTRIQVMGAGEVDLESGRILARIRKGEIDLIVTGKGSAATRLIQSEKSRWGETIFVKKGDRFEILSLKGLASVQSHEGQKLRLGPRRFAVILAGKERQNDLLPFTSDRLAWAQDFLAFLPKEEWRLELEKELPDLLGELGSEKDWMKVDLKLRHLGREGIQALFGIIEKYKKTEDSKEIQKRLHAAGLVSNLADLGHVDQLFHYLMDDSPRVRASMYFGLERLIGSFYSEGSKKGMVWSEGTAKERAAEQKKWKAWWAKK